MTRFTDHGDDRQCVEVQIIQLLTARVAIALGVAPMVPIDELVSAATTTRMMSRHLQDIALVRADLVLADGRADAAGDLIAPIRADPATPIGGWWARLVPRSSAAMADPRPQSSRPSPHMPPQWVQTGCNCRRWPGPWSAAAVTHHRAADQEDRADPAHSALSTHRDQCLYGEAYGCQLRDQRPLHRCGGVHVALSYASAPAP